MHGLGLRTRRAAACATRGRLRGGAVGGQPGIKFSRSRWPWCARITLDCGCVKLSIEEEKNYVRCTFASPNAWNDWNRGTEPIQSLVSFGRVVFPRRDRLRAVCWRASTTRIRGVAAGRAAHRSVER